MSLYIDKKYVNLVSGSLEKFKWKKENLATCRCFKCGDSVRNKSKTRGYFFEHKGKYVYKCHNCGFACGLYGVLESVSPTLCKEYSFENFREKEPEKFVEPVRQQIEPLFTNLGVRLDRLNPEHKAVKYVASREIPKEKYNNFYYCNDFSEVLRTFGKDGRKEDRLVIPFYDETGELLGVQGRSFNECKDAIRYITVKRPGCESLWYNLDKVDPRETVFVTEGPIDSMFIPNAVAMQGAKWIDELPDKIKKSKVVFIFDNEPRNEEIINILGKYVESGRHVVIWPSEINKKDVNDMVKAYGPHLTMKLIINNVYSGLTAKMKYTYWKRV
jgi:hypothetical protein